MSDPKSVHKRDDVLSFSGSPTGTHGYHAPITSRTLGPQIFDNDGMGSKLQAWLSNWNDERPSWRSSMESITKSMFRWIVSTGPLIYMTSHVQDRHAHFQRCIQDTSLSGSSDVVLVITRSRRTSMMISIHLKLANSAPSPSPSLFVSRVLDPLARYSATHP